MKSLFAILAAAFLCGVAFSQPDVGAKATDSPVAPDGAEVQLDLPGSLHMKNKGGSDGAGLCVFTSISHSARWQSVPVLDNFRDWMTKHPGGGWPGKVDSMIAKIAKEKGVAPPEYIQIEDSDLEILKLACRMGRMPGVTYGFSPSGRYNGQKISHMVTLLHADDKWFCVLDNNYPNTYEWMTPQEFLRTYTSGSKSGWAVVLLNPGPPPIPHN